MKRTETKQLPISEKDRKWHLVDLSGKILGRVVTGIAGLIIGKTKTAYAPHTDCGDYVVAINAAKNQGYRPKTSGQKVLSSYWLSNRIKANWFGRTFWSLIRLGS